MSKCWRMLRPGQYENKVNVACMEFQKHTVTEAFYKKGGIGCKILT